MEWEWYAIAMFVPSCGMRTSGQAPECRYISAPVEAAANEIADVHLKVDVCRWRAPVSYPERRRKTEGQAHRECPAPSARVAGSQRLGVQPRWRHLQRMLVVMPMNPLHTFPHSPEPSHSWILLCEWGAAGVEQHGLCTGPRRRLKRIRIVGCVAVHFSAQSSPLEPHSHLCGSRSLVFSQDHIHSSHSVMAVSYL